jgi:hypothetical protein
MAVEIRISADASAAGKIVGRIFMMDDGETGGGSQQKSVAVLGDAGQCRQSRKDRAPQTNCHPEEGFNPTGDLRFVTTHEGGVPSTADEPQIPRLRFATLGMTISIDDRFATPGMTISSMIASLPGMTISSMIASLHSG